MKRTFLYLLTVIFSIITGLSIPAQAYDIFQELNKVDNAAGKQYLHADEAFIVSIDSQADHSSVSIDIAPDYYLYRHLLKVSINSGKAVISNLPDGSFHSDEFMGDSRVFFNHVDFDILYSDIEKDSTISLSYQGCTQGMCYPPLTKTFNPGNFASSSKAKSTEQHTTTPAVSESDVQERKLTDLSAATANSGKAQDEGFSLLSSAVFLLIGLSLAFTPCVFPMYPILSLILFGSKKTAPQGTGIRHNFPIAFCFVQGIAVTYTVIGILCGSLGAQTHAFLQQPAILIIFSLVFIVLSLSMLGLYDLQLPAFITTRLQKISDSQSSRSMLGAFTIGVISSLVCSPCTTAPVSASLLYTIQNGNILSGGINLYMMGFGMGIPMLIIGTFGKHVLPKSGDYLKTIKQLLGIFSLSVPVILLDRIIPGWVTVLCAAALIGAAVILLAVRHLTKYRLSAITLTTVICITGAVLMINRQDTGQLPKFTNVTSIEELDRIVANNKHVLIDFYASWCTSCKQYEKETFSDPDVRERMKDIKLVRVDLSEQNEQNASISSRFGLVGLPSVALFKHNQKVVVLSGLYNSNDFMDALNNYLPEHGKQ